MVLPDPGHSLPRCPHPAHCPSVRNGGAPLDESSTTGYSQLLRLKTTNNVAASTTMIKVDASTPPVVPNPG
jgi:hypothetical protein